MLKIEFEELTSVEDEQLRYAVIVSQYQGLWIYCQHRERRSWEIPGGRREPQEPILETAKRELYEETGAVDFEITPICAYCVVSDTKSYGLLCYALIHSLGQLPVSEISSIKCFKNEPKELTYPSIQPFLLNRVKEWLKENPFP